MLKTSNEKYPYNSLKIKEIHSFNSWGFSRPSDSYNVSNIMVVKEKKSQRVYE